MCKFWWLQIVVLEATLGGEEFFKASGLFLAGAKFTSLGIADQGDAALATITTGCLDCWPPLFVLQLSMLEALMDSGKPASLGLPEAGDRGIAPRLEQFFVQIWWMLSEPFPCFLFFADSCCAFWGPPRWIRRSGWKALGWDELRHSLKYLFGYCPASQVWISPKVPISFLEKII